jgi:outer membrane receptor protein involved in Fe transport
VDIDDNVTLRGSSNFKVLIDGKPTQVESNEALKQIPSATIQNIEIITNPSAKYEPDGAAGIINVVMKKQKGRGISALANANAGLKNRYGGDALLGYKQGIANSYVGGNLNRYVFSGNGESERRTFNDSEALSVTTIGTNDGGPTIGGGRAGVELQLGPRDESSLSGRYRFFKTGGDNSADVTERYMPGDSSRQHTDEGGWHWAGQTYFALVDHEHDFDTTGHKLVARVSLGGRAANSHGWNNELDSIGDTTSGFRNEQGGPWRRLNLDLEYTLPKVAGGKLDAGYQGHMERTDGDIRQYWYSLTTHNYELDSLSSHAYYGTEDVHAAYATWSWSWKKLGVQPGLRGEYGNRVVSVPDMDSTYKVSRWDYFPSLHLSYSLPADQQVTASYSRRIDRPGPWDLTPFLVWDDAHTVSRGNPRLTPQYTDSYEAGYELPFGANSVNAGVYYRVTKDLFQWVTMKYAGDSTVLLMTSRNVGRDHSLGVELSANLSPFKWLTLSPGADLSDYRVEGSLLGQDFSHHSFAWSGSLNLDFHLPTGT